MDLPLYLWRWYKNVICWGDIAKYTLAATGVDVTGAGDVLVGPCILSGITLPPTIAGDFTL